MCFQRECVRKYDEGVYELFNKAFEQLPVAAVLNGGVFVVHGGVDEGVSVEALEAIPRQKCAPDEEGAPTG